MGYTRYNYIAYTRYTGIKRSQAIRIIDGTFQLGFFFNVCLLEIPHEKYETLIQYFFIVEKLPVCTKRRRNTPQ